MGQLERLRQERNMTQEELADTSGVSRSTIARLESDPGEWNRVRRSTLRKIAAALGTDSDTLAASDPDSDPDSTPDPTPALPDRGAPRTEATARAGRTINPVLPITDRAGLPRPAHLDEDWMQQFLCYLEAMRDAYQSFVDQVAATDAMTDADLDRLNTLTADALATWSRRHLRRMPTAGTAGQDISANDPTTTTPSTEGQVIGTDDALTLGLRTARSAPIGPVTTTAARLNEIRGSRHDRIQDSAGTEFLVECRHDTESEDPNDHPFQVPVAEE